MGYWLTAVVAFWFGSLVTQDENWVAYAAVAVTALTLVALVILGVFTALGL